MTTNKKIAIINRSFWPESAAIGESLLLLSEKLTAAHMPTVVITQSPHSNLIEKLDLEKRGRNVKFHIMKSKSNSSSSILSRIIELVFFSIFMFLKLIKEKPDKVYIATNPPVIAPYLVMAYCFLFKKKYVYHLQDIHPEATEVALNKKSFITNLARKFDNITIRRADAIITLTSDMESYITKRAKSLAPIYLLENPAIQKEISTDQDHRNLDIVFCGNAGRLQRIPLILSAIESYLKQGGKMTFTFIGSGIHSELISDLAEKYKAVKFLGYLPPDQVAILLKKYKYGLLPLEDEVTKYAFPSKTSSYMLSGCKLIAICSKHTSLAQWVLDNDLGFVSTPKVECIVDLFQQLEIMKYAPINVKEDLLIRLLPETHTNKLMGILRD